MGLVRGGRSNVENEKLNLQSARYYRQGEVLSVCSPELLEIIFSAAAVVKRKSLFARVYYMHERSPRTLLRGENDPGNQRWV